MILSPLAQGESNAGDTGRGRTGRAREAAELFAAVEAEEVLG